MNCYSRPDSLMRPDREMGQSNSNFHLASTLGKFLFSKGEQFGLEALELSVMSETGHTMRLDMGTRTKCMCLLADGAAHMPHRLGGEATSTLMA